MSESTNPLFAEARFNPYSPSEIFTLKEDHWPEDDDYGCLMCREEIISSDSMHVRWREDMEDEPLRTVREVRLPSTPA